IVYAVLARSYSGALRGAFGFRFRIRNGRKNVGTNFRAVLHDQRNGERNGAGTVDGLWSGEAAWRISACLQRAIAGQPVPHLFSCNAWECGGKEQRAGPDEG